MSLISRWSQGSLSQIALNRERASARQPLTDRPAHAERASESVAWICATWPSNRARAVRRRGRRPTSATRAPCWRSCGIRVLLRGRVVLRTAQWWGGTRSSSKQVSETVPALSTNSSTKAQRGAWSTPLPTNGGKWSSSLLAPRILALHLLLLLRREVVLDVEPNANLLGRLALDLVRNGLAGQVKQGLDVQVVRRQDQVEERLVVNLRGGQSSS